MQAEYHLSMPLIPTPLSPRSRALAQGRLVQAEYHLSLSRTVAVRKPQIQPLLADLRRCLASTPRRGAGSTGCWLTCFCA